MMAANSVYNCLLSILILAHQATGVAAQCNDEDTTVFPPFKTFVFRYPLAGTYEQNLNCTWLFDGGNGNRIYSRVANSFVDCADTLQTFDGNALTSPVLEESGCSNPLGSTKNGLTSTQNFLLVNLRSDSTTNPGETGFSVEMISGSDQSQQSQACPDGIQLIATSEEQILTSPNFPDKFIKNTQCQWDIEAEEPSATISINVYFLDMDEFRNVCYDKLEIVEGSETKTLCGRNRFYADESYTSTGHNVTIKFTAGQYGPFHGFTMSYKQIVPITTPSTSGSTTTLTTVTKTTTEAPTTIPPTSESTTTQTTMTPTSTEETTTNPSTSGCATTETPVEGAVCDTNEEYSSSQWCRKTCKDMFRRRSCIPRGPGCKCKRLFYRKRGRCVYWINCFSTFWNGR